jgi:hypothetical protein
MVGNLRPDLRRQLMFIGGSLGLSLLFTYLFGFLVGFVLNLVFFVGIMFYIRSKQLRALKSFGFSDERVGRGFFSGRTELKYSCLSCGAEVKGARCKKCGSSMKKPIF